jgi:glycosyltransferase involved in cell wall biosynthesis
VRNVPEWVKAADILVFPATEDHFGRPIIEAGYMKIPVIASDGDTSKELRPDEKNGLLFHNGSEKDLIEKIERLAINKTLRENMGVAGRKLAEERYSLDKQVSKVLAVLNELECD